MKTIVAVLGLLLLFSAPARAAAPTPTVYDVDVLVFSNRLPDLESGEIWTREDPKAPDDLKDAISPPETSGSDSVLSRAAAALEKDGHYRILVHRHWQQTADARSETKPVRIQSSDKTLDGTFRFYLSRFLLVDVNLLLRDPKSETANGPMVYHLNERRRVKVQEINYFDHPKFGVLVRITHAAKS